MAKGWLEPIKPKKKKLIDVARIQRKVRNELSTLLINVNRDAADYEVPPPSPEVYIRRNRLKQSWSKRGPFWQGRDLIGIVGSSGKTAPYNVFVRGPKKGPLGSRQARHMARRGWLSITEIANKHWPSSRRRFIRILKGA